MKATEHGYRPRLTRDVDDWVFAIRTTIIGTMIANQVFDYMNRGRGAPDKETMARFAEEAAAVADLWEEA
jgi:hypothetical protein